MAADPNSVGMTPGDGTFKVATYRISEEAENREIQRVGLNTAEGEDVAVGSATTVSVDVTRPADTNTYAANDVWATSTSAPTTGGSSLTGVARQSGGSGMITDIVIVSSAAPTLLLQGELWIFDSAVTAVNDNAAFTLSDADAKKLVARIPFTMEAADAALTCSICWLDNLNLNFTASGSADLRFLIKVKNAYVPTSAEVLTVRAKIQRSN